MTYWVYVIATVAEDGFGDPPIKVGYTTNLESRINQVKTGNPARLVMYAKFCFPQDNWARRIEKEFHAKNSKLRLNGEWFQMHPWDAIRALCKLIRSPEEENWFFPWHAKDDIFSHIEMLQKIGVLFYEELMRWDEQARKACAEYLLDAEPYGGADAIREIIPSPRMQAWIGLSQQNDVNPE